MSFRDLSQIADVSLLNISRSNSNQLNSVLNDKSETILKQNALKSLSFCENSISDYTKLKFIFDTVQQCSIDGTLPDETANKLKGLLQMHEIDHYIHLPSTEKDKDIPVEELIILGIPSLPKYQLTYEERLSIKSRVEMLLREKTREFISRYKSLSETTKETTKTTETGPANALFDSEQTQLLQWKDKMEELCKQYEDHCVKYTQLMDKWKELKHKDINEIYCKKAEYLLLQAQVAEVQAKITKLSCSLRMFNETPVTLDAFKILNEMVEKKISVLQNEIKQKENLKKQYEDLKNTEFDNVLKDYIQICNAIEKKKSILDKL